MLALIRALFKLTPSKLIMANNLPITRRQRTRAKFRNIKSTGLFQTSNQIPRLAYNISSSSSSSSPGGEEARCILSAFTSNGGGVSASSQQQSTAEGREGPNREPGDQGRTTCTRHRSEMGRGGLRKKGGGRGGKGGAAGEKGGG